MQNKVLECYRTKCEESVTLKGGKKKIFISGVAGFLGSHLADAMIKDGHEVIGCDNLIGGYIDNIPEEVDYYQVDCRYLNTMNKLLKGVDIVYHTACTAYEGLSVFSPELICQNTYQITAALASAAVSQNVKRFVYCSSMARYGTQDTVPFTEDMIPKPQDPYGISKYAAEELLRCLGQVHGMEVVIAVPHNIIGPRQKYDDPYRNVASIMINMMLQGRQPMIYGDGEQKRCFSFVQDDIACLTKLAFQDGLDGEVVNIGPDEEFVTINELARVIARQLGEGSQQSCAICLNFCLYSIVSAGAALATSLGFLCASVYYAVCRLGCLRVLRRCWDIIMELRKRNSLRSLCAEETFINRS